MPALMLSFLTYDRIIFNRKKKNRRGSSRDLVIFSQEFNSRQLNIAGCLDEVMNIIKVDSTCGSHLQAATLQKVAFKYDAVSKWWKFKDHSPTHSMVSLTVRWPGGQLT